MRKEIKKISRVQLDKKIRNFNRISSINVPSGSWVFSLRNALGLSLSQLAKKMNISAQSVKEIEEREKEGRITLKILKDIANALELKFVYGFSAPNSSLEKILKKQANKVAREIVQRTDKNMKLEDQGNSKNRLNKAIKERTQALIDNQDKCLWD
jgi:predicted DNA-binding mobile mystery protein A